VQQTNLSLWLVMTTKGPAPTATAKLPPRSGRLSSEILAKMDRRSVAAHPWHDLEIGNYSLHSAADRGPISALLMFWALGSLEMLLHSRIFC
jgi:hypothetical protein